MTTIVSLANLLSHFFIRALLVHRLLLCLAPLVFATALAQARQEVVDGPPLDNVVITTEQARTKLQALLDVKRFTHSIAIGRIAKDERLVAFTDGFMERNNIDVLTIAYIDSDELWPRVFRNARKRKIANAPSDQLLAGEIMFIPQLEGRDITGYTVTLSLHGKQAQEPLLNLSPEELELIASDVSQQQLGDAQFATPAEAQASAVNAMIAALQRVELGGLPQNALSLVTFQPASSATLPGYGFDRLAYDQLAGDYPLATIAGQTVSPAWKSLKSNTPDKVEALAADGATPVFEMGGVPLQATAKGDNTFEVTLNGGPDASSSELLALTAASNGLTMGLLNTISYDEEITQVKIVPINGAGDNFNLLLLEQKLNTIYRPAIASWNVAVADNVTLPATWDATTPGLADSETGMLSNYTREMNSLIDAYRRKFDREKDTYYVFLVNKAESAGKRGYMPRKKQWGFVFTDVHNGNIDALAKTIAHELGHGVFRLEHTFSEKGLPHSQTNNLMDYGNGTALYKYQWDYVHDPVNVVTLFDDEEEGAMVSEPLSDELGLYFVSDDDAWYRQQEYPFTPIRPSPPDHPKIPLGTQVDVQDIVLGLNGSKQVRVAKMVIFGETEATYTALGNLSKVEDLIGHPKYEMKESFHSLNLPYSPFNSSKILEKGESFIGDKVCGKYIRVKGNQELIGNWVLLSKAKRVPNDASKNFDWMTDISLVKNTIISEDILANIAENREGINDRSIAEIYGNNRLKSFQNGSYYIGESTSNPSFSGTEFEQEVKKEIYEEIGKEGGVGAINTWDAEIFTWGKGFAVKGLLMDVIEELFNSAQPNFKQIFANVGILLVEKNFWVLDESGAWKKDDASSKSYAASKYISSNQTLLSFFIEVAEKSDYAQAVLNAQAKVFTEKGAGKYPAYIINDSKTGYSESWSHESVTVLAHLSHWAGYSWAKGTDRYKNTKGNLDKILYEYLYNSVKAYSSMRTGSVILENMYRWNVSFNILDRLRQFGNPESAGLSKLNDTWSSHKLKIEFRKDKDDLLRAKKSDELKFISNQDCVLIEQGEEHLAITKDAGALTYLTFENKSNEN